MDTIINFKTDKKIKTEAMKIAEKMGLNLSTILNIYLRNFVNKKEVYISLNEDESNPSQELLDAVKEAREEKKSGKMKKFNGVEELVTHLEKV